MFTFTKNKIISEADSIAEVLRSARKTRGLKIAKIAADLGIGEKYLSALEGGQFQNLPDGIYGKNFLREYGSYLGLDTKALLEMFEASTAEKKAAAKKELFSKQVVGSKEMLGLPRLFKNLGLTLLVLVCFLYLTYRLERIVAAPKLELINPTENFITVERSLQIIGKTEPETEIVINGEKILSDSAGNFLATVNLKTGINMIIVTAQKKFGRESQLTRQVLVRG